MDYGQCIATIRTESMPELKDFERVTVFAHTVDKDVLWAALTNTGVHPLYRSLLAQAVQRRIVEELEREQARQRKLEEEARLEAAKDEPRPRSRSR
jgi:D-alanyl-D-alanine dipeptidase